MIISSTSAKLVFLFPEAILHLYSNHALLARRAFIHKSQGQEKHGNFHKTNKVLLHTLNVNTSVGDLTSNVFNLSPLLLPSDYLQGMKGDELFLRTDLFIWPKCITKVFRPGRDDGCRVRNLFERYLRRLFQYPTILNACVSCRLWKVYWRTTSHCWGVFAMQFKLFSDCKWSGKSKTLCRLILRAIVVWITSVDWTGTSTP